MEEALRKFMDQEWPGFKMGKLEHFALDHEDQCKFDNLKQAFEAGWNARDDLAIGAM